MAHVFGDVSTTQDLDLLYLLLTGGTLQAAGDTVELTIKGFGGQTAHLQDWETSAPAIVASVDIAGAIASVATITAKPAGAGIGLDPNAATGNFILSLSPANLTGNHRVTFPNADITIPSTFVGGSGTEHYVAIFGAGGTVVENSQIRDDGATIAIGGAPSTPFVSIVGGSDIVQLAVTGFTTQTSDPLQVTRNDTITNAVSCMVRLTHNTSGAGAGAAGLGAALDFYLEDDTSPDQQVGRLSFLWGTATTATRKARGVFSVYDTAAREGMRIEASGSAPMIGFYGHAAAVQSAAYTTSNAAADRSIDCHATTLNELLDVVATVINDLQAVGILG